MEWRRSYNPGLAAATLDDSCQFRPALLSRNARDACHQASVGGHARDGSDAAAHIKELAGLAWRSQLPSTARQLRSGIANHTCRNASRPPTVKLGTRAASTAPRQCAGWPTDCATLRQTTGGEARTWAMALAGQVGGLARLLRSVARLAQVLPAQARRPRQDPAMGHGLLGGSTRPVLLGRPATLQRWREPTARPGQHSLQSPVERRQLHHATAA